MTSLIDAFTRFRRHIAPGWSGAARGILLVALASCGWLLLTTHFMPYDDEGYVLWSVRGFCDNQPLYTEVFSQYGPLFFLGYRALHAVSGIVFDNDSGRVLTLIYWLLAAGVSGMIARRITRSEAAGMVATTLAFVLLAANRQEPFHPGSLLAVLVAAAAYVGIRGILTDKESGVACLVAPLAAAALLIKINVGVFLFVALGGWMLANARAHCAGLRMTLILGACSGPFLVAHGSLADPRVLVLGILVATGTVTLAIAATTARRNVFGSSHSLAASGIAAGLIAASAIGIMHYGTSPQDLLEGALLAPLRHPGVYSSLIRPPEGMPVVASLALVLGTWLAINPSSFGKARLVGALSIIASAAAMLPPVLATQAPPPELFALFLAAPLGALIALPGAHVDATPESRAMIWLAWVLSWQVLHAYPVTGSQAAWGSFLLAPLAVAGFWSGLAKLRPLGRLIVPLGTTMAALATTMAAARLAHYAIQCRQNSVDPALPGACSLRLEPRLGEVLSALRANLAAHAGTVFSLPGMFSFNIWTGKAPPTGANVTHWFSLLGTDKQLAIREGLRADPRALVVVQTGLLNALATKARAPDGPLVDYIEHEMRPVFRADGYELRAHPGRDMTLIGVFQLNGTLLTVSPSPGTERPCAALLTYRTADDRIFEIRLAPEDAGESTGEPPLRFRPLPRPLPPDAVPLRMKLLDAKGRRFATLVANTLPPATR